MSAKLSCYGFLVVSAMLAAPSAAADQEVAARIRSSCSNFSNEWLSDDGEYINIVQDENCTIIATNPVQKWSPARGVVEGNVLRIFAEYGVSDSGTLIGNFIHWNIAPVTGTTPFAGSVWHLSEALPLKEGLQQLRWMLQIAIETEQSVIQPYLSALYSIKAGTNMEASSLLHGVVVEEMLHMTCAANVLNAIGGHPIMDTREFVPVYPYTLAFMNLSVSLAPFSQAQTKVFRRIEGATWGPDNQGTHSVGVWYFQIGVIMRELVQKYGEKAVFSGDPALQIDASSSRGKVQGVYDYADASAILTNILTEGEGVKNSIYETSPFTGQQELSHWHRFNEVVHDRHYLPADYSMDPTGEAMGNNWSAVYNFAPNPRAADYSSHPDIHEKMMTFNSCYTHLLIGLHQVFNGSPGSFWAQVKGMMILAKLSKELMAIPVPGKPGMMVGAPWEWVDVSNSSTPSCPYLEGVITV